VGGDWGLQCSQRCWLKVILRSPRTVVKVDPVDHEEFALMRMLCEDLKKEKSGSKRAKQRLFSGLRSNLRMRVGGGRPSPSDYVGWFVGCSGDELLTHLERLFEPGMSWENYGGYTGWHIDHVVPCSWFDLEKEDHQILCFHWKNLRPLWGGKNMSRSDRMTMTEFKALCPEYQQKVIAAGVVEMK
jgi:hypothetical protein